MDQLDKLNDKIAFIEEAVTILQLKIVDYEGTSAKLRNIQNSTDGLATTLTKCRTKMDQINTMSGQIEEAKEDFICKSQKLKELENELMEKHPYLLSEPPEENNTSAPLEDRTGTVYPSTQDTIQEHVEDTVLYSSSTSRKASVDSVGMMDTPLSANSGPSRGTHLLCYYIESLSEDVFKKIPKYMLGRITLNTLNSFIDQLNRAIKVRYNMPSKGKLQSKHGNFLRNTRVPEYFKGKTFITEDDILDVLGQKTLDKKSITYMIILKHAGRIKEEKIKDFPKAYVIQ